MNKTLVVAAAVASLTPLSAIAEYSFYGRADVSFDFANEGDDSFTALESNASRLGLKGSEPINEDFEVIYQVEYEIYTDSEDTFGQRNIYAGVKGDFGSVIAGHFDTPLKRAQNDVDMFNDLQRGDIKRYMTVNDNRVGNHVMYASPEFSGLTAYASLISSEDDAVDNGKSVALAYTRDNYYAAVAYDADVEEEDSSTVRLVGQYNREAWQFGAMFEQFDPAEGDSADGFVLSAGYELDENWLLKGQVSRSDIVEEGTDAVALGADYRFQPNFKVYGYFTQYEADDDLLDNSYIGGGLHYRF